MFTVVILSDAARTIIGRSRVFFEPFEEAGGLAFCRWDQSSGATSLAQALPDLREIIRGKKEWRAVVVDHVAGAADSERNAENPFDFADNRRRELNLERSKHPLVRIAHVLLGYPEMSAMAFEPMLSYREHDTGDRVFRTESELALEYPQTPFAEVLAGLGNDKTKYDVQVHFKEIEYSPQQNAAHEELVEQYRMKEVRPSEVVFISTRTPVEVNSKEVLHEAWRSEAERTPSMFVERNDYPPSSRFAVYDLVNPENSGYEQDELRFWLAVLTVATNLLPPSAFQAEHVYRISVDFSDGRLAEMLNAHLSRLIDVRDRLTSMIEQPRRPPDVSVSDYLTVQHVPLEFDRIGGAELRVGTDGYSLVSDVPRSEIVRWESDFADLSLHADAFMRRPRRVLGRAVFEAHDRVRRFPHPQRALTAIEREEIEDELGKRIGELTTPATTDILDRGQVSATLKELDGRVGAHIRQRMRRGTVLAAGVVALAVWLASFTPYLLQAATKGWPSAAEAVLVVVIVLGIVAASGLLTLLWMRMRMRRLLADVNRTMRDLVSRVSNGASLFGDYLSKLATYMYARALLLGSHEEESHERARLRSWVALRVRLDDVIGVEKGIVTSLGFAPQTTRVPMSTNPFDPDDEAALRTVFRFPVADIARARFNDSGETIAAPYEFITHLELARIPLVETDATPSDAPRERN